MTNVTEASSKAEARAVISISALEEERNGASGRKQKYTHFTPEARAKIATYAAQCGNATAVKHFTKDFPSLGESIVCLFKKQY